MKLFSFLVIFTLFLSPISVKALPTNFGGQITGMFFCNCSANWILTVRDVRYQSMPLIYQPRVTLLYKMRQSRPDVNSLGDYIPGAGQCLVYSGNSCVTIPTLGLMFRLGTSLAISP